MLLSAELLEFLLATISLHFVECLRCVSQRFSRLVRRSSLYRRFIDLTPMSPVASHFIHILKHFPALEVLVLHFSIERSLKHDFQTILNSFQVNSNLRLIQLPIHDLIISAPTSILSTVHFCTYPDQTPVTIDSSALERCCLLYDRITVRSFATTVDEKFLIAARTQKLTNLSVLFISTFSISASTFVDALNYLPLLTTVMFRPESRDVFPILQHLSDLQLSFRFHCLPNNSIRKELDPFLSSPRLLPRYESISGLELNTAVRFCPQLVKFSGRFSDSLLHCVPQTLTSLITVSGRSNYSRNLYDLCVLVRQLPRITSVGVKLINCKVALMFYCSLTISIKALYLEVKVSCYFNLIPEKCPNLLTIQISGKPMLVDSLVWSEIAPALSKLRKLEEMSLNRVYFDGGHVMTSFKSLRRLSISSFTSKRHFLCISIDNLLCNSPYLVLFTTDSYIDNLVDVLVCHCKRLTKVWIDEQVEEEILSKLDSLRSLLVRPKGFRKKDILLPRK
ncbi:hypothetical protein GEMRC1_002111 [Eukaryota sp. GEM-RC1]